MQNYELMFIHKVSDDKLNKFVGTVKGLVARCGGEVKKVDVWGKKYLPAHFDNITEGEYGLIAFEIDRQNILSVDKELKRIEDLIRYMLIRTEQQCF